MKVKALKNFILDGWMHREGMEYEVQDDHVEQLVKDGFVSECGYRFNVNLKVPEEVAKELVDKEIATVEKPKKKGRKAKKDA